MRFRTARLTRAAIDRRDLGIASLHADRDRDIEDLDAMRRLLTLYLPVMTLVPLVASAIYYMAG